MWIFWSIGAAVDSQYGGVPSYRTHAPVATGRRYVFDSRATTSNHGHAVINCDCGRLLRGSLVLASPRGGRLVGCLTFPRRVRLGRDARPAPSRRPSWQLSFTHRKPECRQSHPWVRPRDFLPSDSACLDWDRDGPGARCHSRLHSPSNDPANESRRRFTRPGGDHRTE